jgi:hypothetical protein
MSGDETGQENAGRPDAGDVGRRIAARDWEVLGAIEDGATFDVAAVIPLARDGDAEVRELAVRALSASADPAPQPLLRGLEDAVASVRLAALRGVMRHAAAIPGASLLRAFDASVDAFARAAIARLLGVHADVAIAAIAEREARERDPEAREALLVALAKRGDPEARERFAALLPGGRGLARRRHLDACRHLGEPWILKPMACFLDDPATVLRVGNDAEPAQAVFVRVCDVAAAIVAEIAPGSITAPFAPVPDATLDAARRYIADLTPA